MPTTHRLQPVKAAALVAAVMLLSVALSAGAGAVTGTPHRLPCAVMHLAPTSGSAACTQAGAQPVTEAPCRSVPHAERAAPACTATPACWRQLDLPPPAR